MFYIVSSECKDLIMADLQLILLIVNKMRKGRELSVSVGDLNMDNEFMSPAANRGSSNNAYIPKDSRIQKLQQRNVKLQEEVIRVEKALSGIDEKTTYGIRLPEIKSDVVKKELENAYKQIKQYEYEIGKRRKLDMEGAYVEQLRKYQRILREKQQLSQKLRKQLLEAKKQCIQYTKMLKDDTLKKEHAEKERKLNADIKWLHQKIKRADIKKNQLNSNLQKEQELIQKIEKELTRLDYSKTFVQNLRNKYLNAPVKTVIEEDEDDDIEPPQERDIDIEDRSPEAYESLMGQVRLYRKLDSDYEQKIGFLGREKEEAEERNMASRNRLLEVEYEMEKVEARIIELKAQLDPKALIPTKIQALREQAKRFSSVKKINKPKLGMAHLYRFSEIGQATKAGKRFIDRNAIGKKPAKIVGVSFFELKQNQKLCGLKATYLIGKSKKQGNKNLLCEQSLVQQRHFDLEEGDFVKTIDCLQDEQGMVVGISMVSARNQILRAGMQTDSRKNIALEPSQIPVCLYGCLLEKGVEMIGTEAVGE